MAGAVAWVDCGVAVAGTWVNEDVLPAPVGVVAFLAEGLRALVMLGEGKRPAQKREVELPPEVRKSVHVSLPKLGDSPLGSSLD